MTTYFFSLPDTEDLIDPSCSLRKKKQQLLQHKNPRRSGLACWRVYLWHLEAITPRQGGTSDGKEAARRRIETDTCICNDLISFLPQMFLQWFTLFSRKAGNCFIFVKQGWIIKKKNFEQIKIVIFTLLPFHKKYPTMYIFRISWLILELNTQFNYHIKARR